MKIYTRRGDAGGTSLLGGESVSKADPRVDAYGTVDELNATLGVVLSIAAEPELDTTELERIQGDLFVLGARLAAARPEREAERGVIPVLDPERTSALEAWIDRLDNELPALDSFILPGGSPVAAQLHVARAVCRRAERSIAALLTEQPDLAREVLPYMNRLSDLLFTLSRSVNRRSGVEETRWTPMREMKSAGSPPEDERP